MNMRTNEHAWYRVPEVWLILFLLGSAVIGSLAFVATAVRHGDALRTPAPHALAAPLPPTSARPADDATP
jgi:hypothetical protein